LVENHKNPGNIDLHSAIIWQKQPELRYHFRLAILQDYLVETVVNRVVEPNYY
jgi:hypothetical protein